MRPSRGTTSCFSLFAAATPPGPNCHTGDFSFALSLVGHHKCKYVTATCYDSEQVLYQKYPQTYDILERFLAHNENQRSWEERPPNPRVEGSPSHKEDVEQAASTESSCSEWEGFSNSVSMGAVPITESNISLANGLSFKPLNNSSYSRISFHSSISAKSLSKYKAIRRKGPFNKIIFNFPHVGGLSTDVNRQVRANQELLVAFFKSCKPLLASRSNPVQSSRLRGWGESESEETNGDSSSDHNEIQDARANGQVIISLFEGERYSLWNVRDLARHSGLRVVTSWRFPWETYPGYRHARTAGEILRKTNGVDAVDKNSARHKKGGSWKGEDREARGFVFEIMDEETPRADPGKKKEAKDEGKARQISRNKRKESVSSGESSH